MLLFHKFLKQEKFEIYVLLEFDSEHLREFFLMLTSLL